MRAETSRLGQALLAAVLLALPAAAQPSIN